MRPPTVCFGLLNENRPAAGHLSSFLWKGTCRSLLVFASLVTGISLPIGKGTGGGGKRTTDRPSMKSLFTSAEFASLPPTVPTWAAGKCLGCGSTAHDRDDPACPAKTGGDVKAWEAKKQAQANKREKRKNELYKLHGFGQ